MGNHISLHQGLLSYISWLCGHLFSNARAICMARSSGKLSGTACFKGEVSLSFVVIASKS